MVVPHHLRACHCCGMIHRLPVLGESGRANCIRCHATLVTPTSKRANQRTLAAALGALALYFPAVSLPMLEIERLGHRQSSSVLSGTWDLLAHGSWFVGIVVLLFSIVLPLVKIVLLLELSWWGSLNVRHRALTYRVMQLVGKWSMMDVMLLALLVMSIKISSLVEFHFGSAVLAFVICVVMSMIASMSFDAYAIWDAEE